MKLPEKTVSMVLVPSDLDDRFDLAKILLSLMVDRHQSRGLKKGASLLFCSWNVALGNKIHESQIPTGNWAVIHFGKLWEYFLFQVILLFYLEIIHPDFFFSIKKRKKIEWK